MATLRTWILAARPKTLFAAFAPVMMGTALAIKDESFHAQAALAALLGAMLIQIGTNFWNDYCDFKQGADTPDRQGPTRAVQAGLISASAMGRATAVVFVLSLLVCGYLVHRAGWGMLLLGVLSIGCGLWYTAGKRSLAYLGIADPFVLVFFGPVAVVGTYYVQAIQWSPFALVAGFAPGLLATGLLAVNNLRDIDQDRQASKRTPAVRFGRAFVRAEYALCLFGAVAVPVVMKFMGYPSSAWMFLPMAVLIPGLFVLGRVRKGTSGKELNPALGMTAMLLLLYAVLFSVGINLG